MRWFLSFSNLSTLLKHDDWRFFFSFFDQRVAKKGQWFLLVLGEAVECMSLLNVVKKLKLYFLHLRLKNNIPPKSAEIVRISRNYWTFWNETSDGSFKLLRSQGIDSKESIPRGAVWQTYSYLVPSPHRLFYRLHFITMKIIIIHYSAKVWMLKNKRNFLTKNALFKTTACLLVLTKNTSERTTQKSQQLVHNRTAW
jgi:hypothetical protein